ncbi:MAG TPA: hypothetical protein VEH04_14385, partial [Verrucomicrobiae bacterium]|nr:hypothetical protein [Verrucomicrobiae bacterium]
VRVFPRALTPVEAAGFTATNFGALIFVPTNIVVQVITPMELGAIIEDDDRPNPPGALITAWTQIAGPAEISLPDPGALTNVIEFTQSGEYVFRIIADDGQVKVYQDLPVTVVEPTSVQVYASDGDAAELGPDTGEFTFQRIGDLNFDLTMQVTMTGTASNAIDFVQIPFSNIVVLPAGVETLTLPVTPFLDHRTEGDETLTFTIVTNVAYTVIGGEATVTIHDSPYGMWNIARFTLEELTDPSLSGEAADFDTDGRFNFVEYAFNMEPKSVETDSPMITTLELNPATSRQHITLTYQRRLEPTDVGYEVRTSSDLVNWNFGSEHIEEIEVVDDGNGLTETVKARVVAPWPTGSRQFVTIRVWLRSTGP